MSDPNEILDKAKALEASGLARDHALSMAILEHRLAAWPTDWGNNLYFVIYGDFDAPATDLEIPELGITILSKKIDPSDTVVRSARTVLSANIKVDQRTLGAIQEASRRINILLGARVLLDWGNNATGWWCWLVHGGGGGVLANFDHEALQSAINSILNLEPKLRRKIDAALYWVREPRIGMYEHYKSDVLKLYAGYWNAFECLIDAVCLVRPQPRVAKSDKQKSIQDFIDSKAGRLSAQDITHCYQTIVNPGLPVKARHIFGICFKPEEAADYFNECFGLSNKQNRLYDIRNAINHGEIDAENPAELVRVDTRMTKLWIIVWRLFACFVHFPAPADRNTETEERQPTPTAEFADQSELNVNANYKEKRVPEDDMFRYRYWSEFLQRMKTDPGTIPGARPSNINNLWFALGKSGLTVNPVINPRDKWIRVELYLKNTNAKRSFRELSGCKVEIEHELGPLDWQELPTKHDCRIAITLPNTDPRVEDDWPAQHAWLLKHCKAFHRIFKPIIHQLS